jgi:hypothetical protein
VGVAALPQLFEKLGSGGRDEERCEAEDHMD